jgi:hypothetical protein
MSGRRLDYGLFPLTHDLFSISRTSPKCSQLPSLLASQPDSLSREFDNLMTVPQGTCCAVCLLWNAMLKFNRNKADIGGC